MTVMTAKHTVAKRVRIISLAGLRKSFCGIERLCGALKQTVTDAKLAVAELRHLFHDVGLRAFLAQWEGDLPFAPAAPNAKAQHFAAGAPAQPGIEIARYFPAADAQQQIAIAKTRPPPIAIAL